MLGGTTHSNLGDLAMQAGIVDWMHSISPGLAVDFLSNNPAHSIQHINAERHLQSPDTLLATPWTHETPQSDTQRRNAIKIGCRFVRDNKYPVGNLSTEDQQCINEFFSALDAACAVVVPGSGSMNSLWWHDWLYPKAFTVLAAFRSGKPVFMSSQGIGPPFTSDLDARLAARMFGFCELVGVRDGNASAAILHTLGIDADKVITTGDDALLFRSPDPMAAVAAELSAIPPERKIIGINLRESSSYGRKYPKLDLQYLAVALDDIGARHNLHFLFIPMSRDAQDNDLTTAKSIIEKMDEKGRTRLVEKYWDAEQTRHLIGETDLALGISYHFLLFALSSGTPALGLCQNPYYKQKLSGLFRLYNCPDWAIELSPGNPALLTNSFDQLVKQKEEVTALLEADKARVHALFASGRKQLAEALRNTIEED